jgi:hypothetical protein
VDASPTPIIPILSDLIILTFIVGNLDLSIIAEVNPALPPPTTQIDFII